MTCTSTDEESLGQTPLPWSGREYGPTSPARVSETLGALNLILLFFYGTTAGVCQKLGGHCPPVWINSV